MPTPPSAPHPRGPISDCVLRLLTGRPRRGAVPVDAALARAELTDDDLHLGLYALYELHYRGLADVDPEAEWSPTVLAFRARLEERFTALLREAVGERPTTPDRCAADLRALLQSAAGPSLSSWVAARGTLRHLQELAIHRSPYQLKEADPHTWAIPRLPSGQAKSALLTLQFDEYGNGEPGRAHAELFAATMRSLGLDDTYGHHLDAVPGTTLATVNLLSMFGLHRRWLGACVGHLAVFEMTSVTPMQRYAAAHRRITGGDEGAEFYDVHVVADAAHEVIAADELVPSLVAQLPELATDVLFGAQALMAIEERFTAHVLGAWEAGASSLLHPLAARTAAA